MTSMGGLQRNTGSHPSAVHGLVSGRQTSGGVAPRSGSSVQLFPVVRSHTSMPSQRLVSLLHGSSAARSFSAGTIWPFAPTHAPLLQRSHSSPTAHGPGGVAGSRSCEVQRLWSSHGSLFIAVFGGCT